MNAGMRITARELPIPRPPLRTSARTQARDQNDKIDRRQRSEFDIVIVDLTRTEGIGFMKERNRINVLLSRAKNGLYVVGNKTWVDSLPRSEAKFLLKFQS